jgi:hypothetical protein
MVSYSEITQNEGNGKFDETYTSTILPFDKELVLKHNQIALTWLELHE